MDILVLMFELVPISVCADGGDVFPVCRPCFEEVSRTRQDPSDGATFPCKLTCLRMSITNRILTAERIQSGV